MQMCGVDLTRIDGIDVTTAFKVLSEIGADMSKFKSAKHFASWLGLCPRTRLAAARYFRRRPWDGQQGRASPQNGGGEFTQQPISLRCLLSQVVWADG